MAAAASLPEPGRARVLDRKRVASGERDDDGAGISILRAEAAAPPVELCPPVDPVRDWLCRHVGVSIGAEEIVRQYDSQAGRLASAESLLSELAALGERVPSHLKPST